MTKQLIHSDNNQLLIYFHGNSEDIGQNIFFIHNIREVFNMSILAIEYPGYGFFTHEIKNDKVNPKKKLKCTSQQIIHNGHVVMRHILKGVEHGGLGYKAENIYFFGRSIGTGPACLFAKHYFPRGLILVSPYTTIRNVAQHMVSKALCFIVAQHFNNLEAIKEIACPIIMVHGKRDKLIPSSHSEQLWKTFLSSSQPGDDKILNSVLLVHPHMTHNEFNMEEDLVEPIRKFMKRIGTYDE